MIDWRKIKRVHFTGIKGVGMTALACCFKDLGIKVTGSDVDEVFMTDKILSEKKIAWQGFSEKNINQEIDLLIFTVAHQGEENPEVKKAKSLGIMTLSLGEALGQLMALKPLGVSVCGVGGKSTTAAMIATLLDLLGGKPSFAIGTGMINPLGVPGRFDKKGKFFIAEADEYKTAKNDPTPKFRLQKPKVIVLTNLEYDHPDIYCNFQETKETFKSFIQSLPANGLLIAEGDSDNVRELLEELEVPVETVGFSKNVDWQIKDYRLAKDQVEVSLGYKNLLLEKIRVSVPGRFNALNAAASLAVVNFLGFGLKEALKKISEFKGSQRRFEFIKEVGERKIYDDYAHHPTQLKATLEAAKEFFPQGKLWAIFQAHTFSRTRALFREFAQSFQEADYVLITPIYASAREKKKRGVSGKLLQEEISKFHQKAFYVPSPEKAVEILKAKSKAGDVIFTLGAGDIFQWQGPIIKGLKDEKETK